MAILQSTDVWESRYKTVSDIDDLKPTNSADDLMGLVDSNVQRFQILPLKFQVPFLDIVFELFNQYKEQVINQEISIRSELLETQTIKKTFLKYTYLLNSLNYVETVLKDWTEDIVNIHNHTKISFFFFVYIQAFPRITERN